MISAFRNLGLLNLCLLLLIAGCGSDSSDGANAVAQMSAVEKATSVNIQIITAQDLEERFTLPASLAAWEDLTLAAEIAGPVDWVEPGPGAGSG